TGTPVPNTSTHRLRVIVRAANSAPGLLGVQVNAVQVADSANANTPVRIAATEGAPLTIDLFGQDADTDLINWTAPGLPRGMLLDVPAAGNGNHAVLRWTPDLFAAQDGNSNVSGTPGLWRFTVTGSDGMADFTRSFEISVADLNQAPRILPMPLQLVREGDTLSFTLRAGDADNDVVRTSLIHDSSTPDGVAFDGTTGYFEWTPGQDVVDNATQNDQPFTFNFTTTDGKASTTQSVQVRVFDVNRIPRLTTSNHAVVIGQSLSIPVQLGGVGNSSGSAIVAIDDDGSMQTQALAISFSGLPEGARYDAIHRRLNWTPGPGQVGDTVITARASDGKNTTVQTFTVRVVAEADANAPKIVVSTTPATPAQPGQTIIATVRADAYSPIASIVVAVRGAALNGAAVADQWQTVALDSAGRLRLTPASPGLIEVRVTATDRDGFHSTQTHTVRVKDPADTQAPALAWSGNLIGATALGQPVQVTGPIDLQASVQDLQLMGYQLEIAAAGTTAWRTLTGQTAAATNSNLQLTLASLDPALLVNGVYQLRLSATDLVGRTSTIEARLIIDTAQKTLATTRVTDASYQLGGHVFALNRVLESGTFGNWTIPALTTQLTTDQPATTASGATAPWTDGARVWLQVPENFSSGSAAQRYLSFTLGTTTEALGSAANAPLVSHPEFGNSQGWRLEAHSEEPGANSAPDMLVRQGSHLYDQITGLPWVPIAYDLIAPDGNRIALDASGHVTAVHFADGVSWLVSDAGIAAVAGDTGARLDFIRDAAGRIARVTGPLATGNGEASSIVYRYDQQGRLILARSLDAPDIGTPYGYDAAGQPFTDTLTANLGAAVNWTGAGQQNQWSGTLATGQTTSIAFAVRDSELVSAVKVPGAQGAVIIAIESQLAPQATLQVTGATVLGVYNNGNRQTTLVRITEAGLKLIRLNGSGNASVTVSLAGDMNHDGTVDGVDSAAWAQAALGANLAGDLNGDGMVDAADRQVLFANAGWQANRAPVASAVLPTTLTHTGLATNISLSTIADDLEGDPVLWRLLGATHGTARFTADGQSLLFTPEAGYVGQATVTVQADDGFAASKPITLKVNVSAAPLRGISMTRLPVMNMGSGQAVQIIGDFADQVGVLLTPGYYQFASDNAEVVSVDTRGYLHASQAGVALISVSAGGYSAHNAIVVGLMPAAPDLDRYGNELNVYPLSIDLSAQGGQRQIDVHVLDGTLLGADISAAAGGTRYFISDPTVAELSADGLVTARLPGAATITVIHGGRQGTMQLKVRLANTGLSMATIEQGVVTQDAEGNTLTIGANALSSNTLASISTMSLGALETPLPASERLPALAAVHIDLSGATSTVPLQLALKLNSALAAGTEVFFWQEGEIRDADGVLHKTWWLMDNGVVGADGLARTSSTPYVGITGGGNILVTGTAQVDNQTGAAKISGALINTNALWSSLASAAIMPTSIMAASALSAFSAMGFVQAIRYTIEGSYQLQIPQGALLPNSTVTIPVPTSTPLAKPAVTGVQYNAKTRLLTVSGQNFTPPYQSPSLFKLKLWLVPIGDQIEKVTASGVAPVNGLIWQAFDVSPQADGTLQITLPEGVALSQHDLYVARSANASLPPGWYQQPGTVTQFEDEVTLLQNNSPFVYTQTRGINASAPTLSLAQAQAVLAAAQKIWSYAGAASGVLNDVTVEVSDLPGNSLSFVSGKTIVLSANAAQWGWYVNTDPESDPAYTSTSAGSTVSSAVAGSAADGKMDLMTTVLAQLGAIAGVVWDGSTDSVVNSELPPGVRRLVGPNDIPGAAKPADGRKPKPRPPTESAVRDAFNNTRAQDAPIYSALVAVAPRQPSVDMLVTTARTIDIFQPNANSQPALVGTVIKDNEGKPLELNGAYAHQIVFNDDGSLAFIAGRNNNIYVFDTMTQDIVSTYKVSGAAAPISSLAINDGWLYVTEANSYGSGNRLVRINIDSGPDFLKKQQTLNIPGVIAPYGFRDIAANSGRYLAISAPAGRIGLTNYPVPARGNVYVIDLYGVGADSQIDPAYVATLDLSAYPSSYLGKGPQYITSGEQRGQFLISNAKDISKGAAGITFDTDATTGKLSGNARLADTALKPESVPGWLQAKYQQNIQRAAGTVVLKYDGKTYALVADYNFLFNDVHFVDYENYGLGKQIGGKIGVIQDPFGEDGDPVYLGATTPIPGVALDQATLDQNGMLYASGFVEDTSGQYSGGQYSDMMYRSIFVWNASQLVQAALTAQQSGRKLTLPIDRDGSGAQSRQYPAVTPARYDTAGDGKLFGWIYGMGTYSSRQAVPALTLQNLPYLKQLAPSIYAAAQSAAIAAKVPDATAVIYRGDGSINDTVDTFAVRTLAQLVSLGSSIAASFQGLIGEDNAALMQQIEDAQLILRHTGYNTADSGIWAGNLASAAQAVDGFIGGMALIETNAAVGLVKAIATDGALNLPSHTDFTKLLADGASGVDIAGHVLLAALKYNPVTLGAEGLYRMGSALIEGNYEALRNESYNMLVLFGSLKFGETPAAKRQLQLAVKQVAFLKQQLRRGVIEETPLRDLVYGTENTKQYVVESARREANGLPVSEGRVLTAEAYVKACDGVLELTPTGEVIYKVCFAAGTLVHTDKGLVPIEKVRVGTRVLSQPEHGGMPAYRPVNNTVAHLDQQVHAVQVKVAGADTLTTLIATPNHPFWVESPQADDQHWMAVECLESGFVLQLADGRKATVHANGLVRRTQHEHIGFASDDRVGVGMVLDLSERQITLADDAIAQSMGKLELGEPFVTPVYNFEVEEFHTYYVGDAAVWVHNTNCDKAETVASVFDRVELKKACFGGETYVLVRGRAAATGEVVTTWVEMWHVRVGDEVLSRCEATGEMAYKKVIKVFQHEHVEVVDVWYGCGPEYDLHRGNPRPIVATVEHPFWVKDKGWTEVGHLQPGDEFLTHNGIRATVIEVQSDKSTLEVYNLEVEDFHTYFVGYEGVWVHNKNVEVEVQQLNLTKNVNAQPEPMPQYNPNPLPGNILGKAIEAKMQRALGKAGLESAELPARPFSSTNTLGKTSVDAAGSVRYLGDPDVLLKGGHSPGKVNLNGAAADIYTPEGGSAFTAAEAIKDKSKRQASVVCVNLEHTSLISAADVLTEVDKLGPPPGLRTLLILDKSGKLIQVDYPATKFNEIVYGTVDVQTGVTTRLTKQPSSTTEVFTNRNQQVLAEGDATQITSLSLAQIQALLLDARQYWLNAGESASVLDSVEVAIYSLAPRVAAMTLGNQITLSSDGAGWGWFVDATPTMQEEFGAGDAPNEFRAMVGDAAAGKMDLLTVLVHEMGHALGLGHVAGDDDLMAQYLEPGVRRLPSASDIATLQLRQAGANSANAWVVGVTFAQAPAVTLSVQPPATKLQYEIVVNSTLTNGQFDVVNNSIIVASGWVTEGNVSITPGAATLTEATTQQTRLNQVFIVGAQDKFLSFTLSDIALDDQSTGPDDAFEVGLLDANTGASLAGAIGLSHSDALLNLQANGTELASQGVTHIVNPNGSRTYLVDLRNIAAGTAVNLSFDLIGFGANGSHVAVSDVRLVGSLQTRDDAATTAEDTVAQIIALANDIDTSQPGFAPVLVGAPMHGQVVVNPDGSFSYTPSKEYSGSDSFTYKVTDGQVDSNVATVSITLTAVNDAPVLDDMIIPAQENTAVSFSLLASAFDVDSDALSVEIISGPAHGNLTLNANGTCTYLATADYNGSDSFSYLVSDGHVNSRVATVSLTVAAVNVVPVVPAVPAVPVVSVVPVVPVVSVVPVAPVMTVMPVVPVEPVVPVIPAVPVLPAEPIVPIATNGQASTAKDVPLTIDVKPVNQTPAAGNTRSRLNEGPAWRPNFLSAAKVIESTVMRPQIASGPTPGTLTINRESTLRHSYTFMPTQDSVGTEAVADKVSEGEADPIVATVTLTVISVGDTPVSLELSITTTAETPLVIDLSNIVSDIDSPIVIEPVAPGPKHGKLERGIDGTFTYTPKAGWKGTDIFLIFFAESICLADYKARILGKRRGNRMQRVAPGQGSLMNGNRDERSASIRITSKIRSALDDEAKREIDYIVIRGGQGDGAGEVLLQTAPNAERCGTPVKIDWAAVVPVTIRDHQSLAQKTGLIVTLTDC
ncbi:MAG: VCBS repeat-containing protein, partial [Burkholderiaceae bacterium]